MNIVYSHLVDAASTDNMAILCFIKQMLKQWILDEPVIMTCQILALDYIPHYTVR